jgi:formylglycine-generating enzyme
MILRATSGAASLGVALVVTACGGLLGIDDPKLVLGTGGSGAAGARGVLSAGGSSAGGAGTGEAATGGAAGITGGAAGAASGGSTPGEAGTGGALVTAPRSCQNLTTQCQGESCCTATTVPAGTFKMGRSESSSGGDYFTDGASNEVPEHDATVASFALDKYEVTVGRFRAFVESYDAWHKAPASNPRIGAGRNENAAIDVQDRTGWGENWTPQESDLPVDSSALRLLLDAENQFSTWTEDVAGNETFPINNVSWTVAFAFCVWDGGRLPTEAEWEYVAAGGSADFLYPWGRNQPDSSRANFVLSFDSPKLAVGGRQNGDGAFGHRDLGGSMNEWVLDWYSDRYYGTPTAPATCNRCVSLVGSDLRSARGGSWFESEYYLRVAHRGNQNFRSVLPNMGIRCARVAQP